MDATFGVADTQSAGYAFGYFLGTAFGIAGFVAALVFAVVAIVKAFTRKTTGWIICGVISVSVLSVLLALFGLAVIARLKPAWDRTAAGSTTLEPLRRADFNTLMQIVSGDDMARDAS